MMFGRSNSGNPCTLKAVTPPVWIIYKYSASLDFSILTVVVCVFLCVYTCVCMHVCVHVLIQTWSWLGKKSVKSLIKYWIQFFTAANLAMSISHKVPFPEQICLTCICAWYYIKVPIEFVFFFFFFFYLLWIHSLHRSWNLCF